jgi:hypothetical protein
MKLYFSVLIRKFSTIAEEFFCGDIEMKVDVYRDRSSAFNVRGLMKSGDISTRKYNRKTCCW